MKGSLTAVHQRKPHTNVLYLDPAIKSIGDWPPVNQSFYADFCGWLREGGYGDSALSQYGIAARFALGLLDKPYWQIDPQADLQRVRDHFAAQFLSAGTCSAYGKGLLKLAQYLRLRCNTVPPERPIHWAHYVGALPDWMAQDVRVYLAHCRRAWVPERQHERAIDLLSNLTRPLRWMAAHVTLTSLADVTPDVWFDYLDARLRAGIGANTLNDELHTLQNWLRFLAEQGRPICQRLLRVPSLTESAPLPRDVPLEQLVRLQREIQAEAMSADEGVRRMGLMDHAWFLLMLHSGLRTNEVRRLHSSDLDLEARRVRIEQSKWLKDRIVYLISATVDALRAYLVVQGPSILAENHVFLYRHAPLSDTYCGERLRTYGKRCGVSITPHQLRHSCATFLLNAGASVTTVQSILGHKYIDTTLGYARVYDGTVAADYYRAMAQVESRLALQEGTEAIPPTSGQLLALVDSLRGGTLNDTQQATVQALRAGILALAQ